MSAGPHSAVARMQVIVAATCAGTTGTAQALGPHATTPVTVGAARICVAVILLGALIGTEGLRRVPWAAVLGPGLGVAGFQLAFFAAVKLTGVAVGSVVVLCSASVTVGVLSWLVNGERPSARWAAATAFGMAGVGLLTVGSGGGSTQSATGVLLALLAGASIAICSVLSRRALRWGSDPQGVTAGTLVVAAALLLPFLVAGQHAWLATPGGAALALYLGIVPTTVAYLLVMRALRRLPSTEVSALASAEPLTATLLGVVVLGEQLGPVAIGGMLLMGVGVAVLTRPWRAAADRLRRRRGSRAAR